MSGVLINARTGGLLAGCMRRRSFLTFLGAALIRGFAQKGYELNRNLTFERRGAEAYMGRLRRLVDELVASKVDIIVTLGYPPALAAKQGTTLPVVSFGAGDPVGTDWWTAWRGRAATSRASQTCRRKSRQSGWSFSRKWLPGYAALRCCGIQPTSA